MEHSVNGLPGYRQWLAPYLNAWARHDIHFGVAGGWSTAQRYSDCFHAACVDIGAGHPRQQQVLPPDTDLTLALHGDVMMFRFPYRYGDVTQRGLLNDRFLDAGLLQEQLLSCMPDQGGVSMMLLPVQHIYRTEGVSCAAFVGRLARFFDAMPHRYRLAVEIHNREYLLPEYFACLREHNVVHVLNSSPAMPSVLDQIQLPHVLTTDVVVVRATWSMDPEWQLGMIETIRRCIDEERTLYIYISDGEQHALLPSLAALMEMLNPDLAKLSPIKQKAA